MSTTEFHVRPRSPAYALPKPVVAFALAAASWVLVYGLGLACLDVLRLVGL